MLFHCVITPQGVPVLGCTYCVGGRAAIEDTSKGYINLEFEEPNFLEILRARIRSDMEYALYTCIFGASSFVLRLSCWYRLVLLSSMCHASEIQTGWSPHSEQVRLRVCKLPAASAAGALRDWWHVQKRHRLPRALSTPSRRYSTRLLRGGGQLLCGELRLICLWCTPVARCSAR